MMRTQSKGRARTTLRKQNQHFGTKQDASVFSKARSLAVKTDRKTPKWHAPNMQASVVAWKRRMSWATLVGPRFGDLE